MNTTTKAAEHAKSIAHAASSFFTNVHIFPKTFYISMQIQQVFPKSHMGPELYQIFLLILLHVIPSTNV